MDLDFNSSFRQIITNMEKTGRDYAQKKGMAWQQEELKYSVLAQEMKKLPAEWSTTRKEFEARSSDGFLAYLKEAGEAITAEGIAKAVHERWKAEFEAMRSLSSLEKTTRQYTS